MKPGFVSAVAMIIMCAIIGIVGVFGYSRYKAEQAKDAEFREQMRNSAVTQPSTLGARMPVSLPPDATTAGGLATPSPRP